MTSHPTRIWSLSARDPHVVPRLLRLSCTCSLRLKCSRVSGTEEVLFFWLMVTTELLNSLNDTSVGQSGWRIRCVHQKRLSFVATLTYVWIQRHFSEERDLQILAHDLCTPCCWWEYLRFFLALRADEDTHVLHHSDDGQLHLVAEVDLFPDILEGHLLSRFKRPFVSKSKWKKECLRGCRDGWCDAVGSPA